MADSTTMKAIDKMVETLATEFETVSRMGTFNTTQRVTAETRIVTAAAALVTAKARLLEAETNHNRGSKPPNFTSEPPKA